MTRLTLMYPPFLTSTLASKKEYAHKIWKVLQKEHSSALERFSHHPISLSLLRKSSWHLRPPSQRSILNSWIVYQSLHLNLSIASHIHPKKRYRLKLSQHVLSASGFTVLPVASLLSVKRAFLSSQLLRNRLGSKLLSNTGQFSTSLLCRLHFSILHWVSEGFRTMASAHVLRQPTSCGSKYFYSQHPQVRNLIRTEHSLIRCEHRVKKEAS